jgi:voltage-gated potassium channel
MDERSRRIERRFEVPLLVAALLVIPVIILEQAEVGGRWATVANVANWSIWLAFASELVVMLAVVPDRRAWLKHHPLEVIIVVLTPPFLLSAFQGIRVLRLLRLARLLPLVVGTRVARSVFSLAGFKWASLTAGLAVLVGGAAFTAVEDNAGGQQLSTWDGIWWAITTATTVGYGDITPETTSGRLIAIGVMAVGIGFVGFFTAAIAQQFIVPAVEADIERMEAREHADDEVLLRQVGAMRDQLEELERALLRRANRSSGG